MISPFYRGRVAFVNGVDLPFCLREATMRSGYKTLTPTQIANALAALDSGQIGVRDMRVYFACFALVAVREAARRYRQRRRETPKELARYQLSEFQEVTGLRTIKPALRRLERAGLVTYAEGEIVIAAEPLPGSHGLLEALRCQRSPRRPIPVPRSVLRFLAQNGKAALARTILAYVVRGLTLTRGGQGTVTCKGTVKVSWIADTFGLSERAARYARAELMACGWIPKDTGSRQRKLNRHGAYFVINLDWAPGPSGRVVGREVVPNVAEGKSPVFAPPPPEKCTDFAPPKEDKKTSYEGKNQKARATEPPGVFKTEKEPTLRNVAPADLWRFDRLEVLYGQAVSAGLVRPSDAQALDFIAAAVRARQVTDGDPVRVFVATVRKRLWHHITLDQEDHARRALTRFRDQNPERFRVFPTRRDGHPLKVSFEGDTNPYRSPLTSFGPPIGPNPNSVAPAALRANGVREEKGFFALRGSATR